MTAITLNLLAEEQHAQEQRAQDPVKIFIAIGIGLVATVVALGVVCGMLASRQQAELGALQAQWEKASAADAGEAGYQTTKRFAEDVTAINKSRWLYAPQLALAKDLVSATIQLSNLGFSLVKDTGSADGAAGDEAGAHGKRAKPTERLFLRLDGKAVAARPELEVDKFLQSLRTDARFSAAVDDIRLRSIARAGGTDGAAEAAFFVIECRYKEAK